MQDFLSHPQNQKVKLLGEDPQEGPDGFPYMMLSTVGEVREPFLNLVGWAADRGIGLVVNPQKENPDFILTYGMLWNYVERGEFLTQTKMQKTGDIQLTQNKQLFAGVPSEGYWPAKRRKIFKEFLFQQGVMQPKVLMLTESAEGPMDLAFSLESLGNPAKPEWEGVLEGFSWFFPRHYSLSIVSEKNILGHSFISL
jgi:hypothetical protein